MSFGIVKSLNHGTYDNPSFEAPLLNSLILKRGVGDPTFARSDTADNSATVKDFEGLIRPVLNGEARFEGARRVRNLLSYSEQFDNAGWIVTADTVSVVIGANSVISPSGTLTADSVMETATTQAHRTYMLASSSASTFSIFVKYNGRRWVGLRSHAGGSNYSIRMFDVLNGVLGSSGGTNTTLTDSSITDAGDGWYRCSISASASVTNVMVFLSPSDTISDGGVSYLGDITKGVYLWGAQLEAGSTASEYVSTNVLSAPYHGTNKDGVKYFTTDRSGTPIADATLKGYLAEGSRTNLLPYSEQFDTAAWIRTLLAIGAVKATAPNGSVAQKLILSSGLISYHAVNSSVVTITANTIYNFSIYLKAAESSIVMLEFRERYAASRGLVLVNLTTKTAVLNAQIGSAVVTNIALTDVGGGWYRASFATNLGGTYTQVRVYVTIYNNAGVDYCIGNDIDGVYLLGAQLEAGSFASSYIPTVASVVTRGADLLTYPVSENIVDISGTAYVEHKLISNVSAGSDQAIIGFSSTPFIMSYYPSTAATRIRSYDGSTGFNITGLIDRSTIIGKQAISWGGSTRKFTGDGLSIVSGSYDGAWVGTTLNIGNYAGTNCLFGTIRNVKIWKIAKSDTFLKAITA
jgi:hypothetical protein